MIATSGISVNGVSVNTFEQYPPTDLDFGYRYSQIDGITTFRGNNFRDSASFGYANIVNQKYNLVWSRATGTLGLSDYLISLGATFPFSGHCWTGQASIVRWPKETREIMNMADWAKEQEELIEVVYPAADGFVYFNELETGKETRNRLNIGITFKGSGGVDPRGYPLLYVGACAGSIGGNGGIFIISLIDGSVLHLFGRNDPFAPRNWHAADAAPLVDAENDRLFYASENGILYILDLNTDYNEEEGTISISPETTRWKFTGKRSRGSDHGFEASPAILRDHIFLADNGGHLICLNLNTLEIVWVKDTLDDTNTSPVISIEDDQPYIYIGTGFSIRKSTSSTGLTPIWKIDAKTGETVWQVDYMSRTVIGGAGGVQGTIALGKYDLEDLIFVAIAGTTTTGGGTLAAISKSTGEVVWEFVSSTSYSWSSPVCVYTEDGKGYIVFATTIGGDLHLIDGLTGERLDRLNLGATVEASPAVFESFVVIGTRGGNIRGIRLT
jgi:hypothetical protein